MGRALRVVTFATCVMVALAGCAPAPAAAPTAAPPAKPTSASAAQPAATTAPAQPTVVPAVKPAAPTQPAAAAKPTAASAANTGSGSAELAEAIAKYYEPAKQEPTLVLYGVGPAESFKPIQEAFEKRFPGINVQGVDQRGRETREKVIAEVQTHNPVASIAMSGFTTQNELRDAGTVEPYVSGQTRYMYDDFVAPGGWANPRYLTINAIAVNTNLVKPADEPKSWKDILDPRWKGKLAMDDVRGSGPGGNVLIGMELLFGTDVDTQLAAQDVTFAPQSGPLWAGLARGEYAMYVSAVDGEAVAQRRQGSPVKYVKPAEGVAPSPISMSLVKNAPAPNAAKLWIEWTMSEEGQQVLAQSGFIPVRKGMKGAEPEADMEGVKFLPNQNGPDAEKYLGDINTRTRRWESLFYKK